MINFDGNFLETYCRNVADDPILYFHTWDGDQVKWQGFIFDLQPNGNGQAQLFEWVTGGQSDVIKFTKAFLMECTFYTTDYEMNSEYHANEKRLTKKKVAAI